VARRALVNRVDGSGGTFAAAETQPGKPGPTLLCRDALLRCSRSVHWPLWNRYFCDNAEQSTKAFEEGSPCNNNGPDSWSWR
jgi:hypothetical protein